MTRQEQDREDLMAEASALVRRVEVQLPAQSESWVIGIRRRGEVSIFVGADPVFQFNTAGELRRGFWGGRLVKAEDRRLIRLEKRRTDSEVHLLRHKLTSDETAEFLGVAAETMEALRRGLAVGDLVTLRQVPSDIKVNAELANWLDSLSEPIVIARAPNVA